MAQAQGAKWSPSSWRGKPIKQVPHYADAGALAARRTAAEQFPAAGVRGRGAQSHCKLGAGGRGQGVPAAGWRLRGKFRRIPPRQYPRHLPRHPADGGGADLCRRHAGGEGGTHCGAIRQAAQRRHRNTRRQDAHFLSRRQHQRLGIHRSLAAARSRRACCRPIRNRPQRSICCARSPMADLPICRMSIAGRSVSSPARRPANAIAR